MNTIFNNSLKVLSVLLVIQLTAQELPKIVPLSPNMASIAKYGEVPVGHFTGTPNINIPLYNVSSGELSLPLSISYHAGGHKVETIASWIGLGWSLNSIPSISRSVRGIPDENGGYFSLYSGRTVEDLWNLRYSNESLFNAYRQDLFYGYKDSEPDIFYYNLPSGSGKFFWNQSTQSFVTFPKSNLRISRDGNVFTLVDQNGVTYLMNVIETNTPNGGNPTNTAWYASKMTASNNSDVIDFVYRDEFQIIKTANVTTKYHRLSGLFNIPPNEGSLLITSTTNAKVIDQIVFRNGSVKFNESNSSREDLLGGYNLDDISIYDNHNQLITKYKFTHRYKSGSGSAIGQCLNAESYVGKWMLLDKLEQLSNNPNDSLVHNFAYNESNFPACRRSAGQDYWGYYNGHDENDDLTPTYSLPVLGNPIVVTGADRSIDPVKSQFGALTKITYPTGGYTEFQYENHVVLDDGIIPEQCIDDYVAMDGGDIFEWGDPLLPSHTETRYFTIDNPLSDCNPAGGAVVEFIIMEPGCNLTPGLADNCARFTIRGASPGNTSLIDITYPGRTIHLPNDTYEMTASFNQSPPNYQNFLFYAEWQNTVPESNTSTNEYAGGIRVKEIKAYTHPTATPITKEYKYTTSFTSNDSSGDIFSVPNFSHEQIIYYHAGLPVGGITETKLLRVKSTSNMQQVAYSGSPVGYAKVFVYQNNPNDIGYTEYSYSHAKDEGSFQFPYPPAESMELERGLITEEIRYKRGSSTFEEVETKSFTYSEHSYNTTSLYPKSSFAIKWENDVIGDESRHDLTYAQNMTPYFTTSGWNSLYSENVKRFYDNDTVSTYTHHYHDNPIHLFKTKTITTNSNNEELTSNIAYPQDIAFPSSAEQALISQNRLSIPIETKTIVEDINDNELSSITQRTVFKNWGSSVLAPEIVQIEKGNTPLENRVIYHDYDDYGNPLEVSKADGTHIAYIWGYHYTYPIAKIENATYAQVQGHVASLQTKSNADNDRTIGTTGNEGILRSALQGLRSALPDAMVTTYTYDPLIGVTSITDPRGYTTYYEYDGLNRLRHVKDALGNVLSENTYYYKNQ